MRDNPNITTAELAGNILLYSRLRTSTTDNKNLNTTVSEVQASMDNLENQISEVQADLSDTDIKNEELQSEIESLQAELEKLQATGLEETTVNNNNDSQSGSDVASEVQEPAQSNQAPQEQGDSDSNQSSTITQEKVQETLDNLFGTGGAPSSVYGDGQGLKW